MRIRITFLIALIVLVGAGQAQLQPSVTVMNASAVLLTNPNVQRHLKLTKQQVDVLNAAFKWFAEQTKGLVRTAKSREEANRKLVGIRAEAAQRALAALNAQQKARLKQLGLQLYGPFAVMAPDVEHEIGLTAAQKKKLKALEASSMKQAQALFQERMKAGGAVPKPTDPKDKKAFEAYKQKVQAVMMARNESDQNRANAIKEATDRKALAVFTPAQLAKWKAMKGAIFPLSGRRG